MKTIFRTFDKGLVLAAILALGAVAGLAQDPCTDVDGQNKLYDQFLEAYKVKTIEGRKNYINVAKSYVEKYGSCTTNETVTTNSKYFNDNISKWETAVKAMSDKAAEDALIARFDGALKAKNWDEVYTAGKEILAKYPEKYRTAEIVLASVGGEEAFKNNQKYNADALQYSRQSIADLESGKSFKLGDKDRYGLSLANSYNFEFNNKEDALAWLNLYIGYITAVGQKNKAAALPFLYKSSQITTSDASKNSVIYELTGSYYFDQLNKLVEEIKALTAKQDDPKLTDDELKALVQQIKDKVAMSNGTSERAIDAYSRAYTFAKDPTIKARMKKNVEDAYKLRFGKTEGLDAWISSTIAKPFVNPTTPIAPISDPEPVKTETTTNGVASTTTTTTTGGTTTVPASTTTNTTGKPVSQPAAKPATTTTAPVKKPRAAVKKKTVKKKTV